VWRSLKKAMASNSGSADGAAAAKSIKRNQTVFKRMAIQGGSNEYKHIA
jgi:hypothetical protein